MSESLILVLMLPVLLIASGIASGSETALFRLTMRERADLRRDMPAVGGAVEVLLAEPRRLLLMILIVNMVVNIAYFAISSVLTARVSGPAMGAIVGAGSVLSIVVFGEILAKVLAGTGRVRFCVIFARPIEGVFRIGGPALRGVDRFVLSPIVRVVRPGAGVPEAVGREELLGLIESGEGTGVIREGERRLLEEVLELCEIRVREAMLPRDSIVWIDASASYGEVLETARRAQATMVLVCEGGLDGRLVGFLHVKRFLAAIHGTDGRTDGRVGARVGFDEWCEKALVVPEQARLDRVLERFRIAGVGRAVCVDERGSVTGLIRGSDIVDELLAGMGESAGDARHAIHLVGLGVWRVLATLSVREWAQAFGVEESEIAGVLARSGTVGGLVLDRLGRLAAVGDEVAVGPATLRVVAVTGRRIEAVEVRVSAPEDGAPGGGGDGTG